MRRLLALLLIAAPTPALAGGGYSPSPKLNPVSPNATAQQQQNNDNSASSASQANQQNQSRSESIGGGIFNYQINNSQGELGIMSVGPSRISCESPSFYANGGVVPLDAYGFYTFENRERSMMYAPQASIGVQLPFGPQVSACVDAMKNQALQTKIATESGILKKCLMTKIDATKASIPMEMVQDSFPELGKQCSKLWGLTPVAAAYSDEDEEDDLPPVRALW